MSPPQLTDQELRLLALLANGLSTDAVARQLGLTERTTRRRVRLVCDRIGVEKPIQAVVWAARSGVLQSPA